MIKNNVLLITEHLLKEENKKLIEAHGIYGAMDILAAELGITLKASERQRIASKFTVIEEPNLSDVSVFDEE